MHRLLDQAANTGDLLVHGAEKLARRDKREDVQLQAL